MPILPGIRGQMRCQLLLLEETLFTEVTGIRHNTQMRLHVIVHRVLFWLGNPTIRTDIVIRFIAQISHTGFRGHINYETVLNI